MGVSISLVISKSVTKEEWEKVYKETLNLVDKFLLTERQGVNIKGVNIICLVPTKEREFRWKEEKVRIGWHAIGDYVYMKTAEDYFLPKDLIGENDIDKDAGDAILGAIPAYMNYRWDDERFEHTYQFWGAKTQGEPYHMYLLAIACLIEDRLKSKVFIYGDITGGQCAEAVKIANKYLEKKIEVPDRCDMECLFKRISKLEFPDNEKLDIFETFYLGNQDDEFGKFISTHFTKEACQIYWRNEFENQPVDTIGFGDKFNKYLLWGFDFEELCGLVNYTNKEGNELYNQFILRVLDAKLHIKEKDCRDALKIDQNESSPYGIGILFAQLVFAGARNKKVNRYLPIEMIRKILVDAFKDKCDVSDIIDDYLKKEANTNALNIASDEISDEEFDEALEKDPSRVIQKIVDIICRELEENRKYDISDAEDLLFYKKGETMLPTLMESLCRSYIFYHSLVEEDLFKNLMNQKPLVRCSWLVEHNRSILIRDIDWERIFTDIETDEESFARYYSMVKVQLHSSSELVSIVKAMILNDDIYDFCKENSARYISSKNK